MEFSYHLFQACTETPKKQSVSFAEAGGGAQEQWSRPTEQRGPVAARQNLHHLLFYAQPKGEGKAPV